MKKRTPEQEERYQKGLKMRAEGASYIRIMIDCDVGYGTVRWWFSENYRKRQVLRRRLQRAKKRAAGCGAAPHGHARAGVL